MTKDLASMADVRAAIDDVDRRIIRLLAERLTYIDRAAEIKQSRDAVRDDARVEDVIEKIRSEAARIGYPPDLAERIYRELVEASIQHEFMKFDAKNNTK